MVANFCWDTDNPYNVNFGFLGGRKPMSRRLVSVLGGLILSLASVGAVLAQDTQPTTTTPTTTTPTTTTVTTTQTTAVQNADGSWTVVEYPVD